MNEFTDKKKRIMNPKRKWNELIPDLHLDGAVRLHPLKSFKNELSVRLWFAICVLTKDMKIEKRTNVYLQLPLCSYIQCIPISWLFGLHPSENFTLRSNQYFSQLKVVETTLCFLQTIIFMVFENQIVCELSAVKRLLSKAFESRTIIRKSYHSW